MSERFIGVDRSGSFKHRTDHLYFVATRFSRRRQVKWVIRVKRGTLEELRKRVADWQEKIAAIMMFKAINKIFHPGYSIQIDKDYKGKQLKKVKAYMKRLFGVVNYGKAFWANPPVEFLPDQFSGLIRHAHKKASMARRKEISPNESEPNIEDLLEILERARIKGIA